MINWVIKGKKDIVNLFSSKIGQKKLRIIVSLPYTCSPSSSFFSLCIILVWIWIFKCVFGSTNNLLYQTHNYTHFELEICDHLYEDVAHTWNQVSRHPFLFSNYLIQRKTNKFSIEYFHFDSIEIIINI